MLAADSTIALTKEMKTTHKSGDSHLKQHQEESNAMYLTESEKDKA